MLSKIHHTIPGQLSSHIVSQYPLFTDFLKGYYEWLQLDNSPYQFINGHLSSLSLNESLEEYVNLIKEEVFNSLPEKVLTDKKLLLRYSKQFFSKIGTKKSFEFIFKILFNESVEISFPREQTLIPSNGKWVGNEYVMYVSDSGNVDSFLYRTISQTVERITGIKETSTADVTRIVKRYANNFVFAEVYLTNIVGEFTLDLPIQSANKEEWILPIASTYEVVNAGSNYINDNIFKYSGQSSFKRTVTSNTAERCFMQYKTLLTTAQLIVERNGSVLTDFTYDGLYVYHSAIKPGDKLTVTYPIYPGLIVVDAVNGDGSVKTVEFIDTPFGILEPQTYIGSDGGVNATITVLPGVLRKVPGYYVNTDGFLSDKDKLQDSEYYQDFSYVIKCGLDVSRYKDLVYKLLHPAGFNMVSEVSILELIDLSIRLAETYIEFLPVQINIDDTATDMYSRYGHIEDFKFSLGRPHYRVDTFKDVSLLNIFETAERHRNFFDNKIDILQAGEYIDIGYFDTGYFYGTVIRESDE